MKAAFPWHGHPLASDDLHNLFRQGRVAAVRAAEVIAIAALAILLLLAVLGPKISTVSEPQTAVLTTQVASEPAGVPGRAFWADLSDGTTRVTSHTPVLLAGW